MNDQNVEEEIEVEVNFEGEILSALEELRNLRKMFNQWEKQLKVYKHSRCDADSITFSKNKNKGNKNNKGDYVKTIETVGKKLRQVATRNCIFEKELEKVYN